MKHVTKFTPGDDMITSAEKYLLNFLKDYSQSGVPISPALAKAAIANVERILENTEKMRGVGDPRGTYQHFWTCAHHPIAIDNFGAGLAKCPSCHTPRKDANIYYMNELREHAVSAS